MGLIGRIAVAIAIGVIAFLLCLLGGGLLSSLGIAVLKTIGAFLTSWATVIGVIVGVLAFFTGWTPRTGRPVA